MHCWFRQDNDHEVRNTQLVIEPRKTLEVLGVWSRLDNLFYGKAAQSIGSKVSGERTMKVRKVGAEQRRSPSSK
jgi:hypothetical protein